MFYWYSRYYVQDQMNAYDEENSKERVEQQKLTSKEMKD